MSALRAVIYISRKNYLYSFRNIKYIGFCSPTKHVRVWQQSFSSQNQVTKSTQSDADNQVSTDLKVAVKENTKSVFYLGVIAVGLGVIGIIFYTMFKELFSSNSPNGVYSNATKRLKKEYELVEALGEPIKTFGEEGRRRRRIAHNLFMDENGKKHMRMQFYVKGSRMSGTAFLEVKENEDGDYEYRYFYVQLNDYKRSMFMIEDNRLKTYENRQSNTLA